MRDIELPPKIQRVMDGFSQLPGVGQKTSMRYTLILSDWSEEKLLNFGQSLKELTELEKCQRCGFFSDGDLCHICLNPSRNDEKKICVVESLSDCLAIERAQQFRGTYHILGGVLNPLLGIGPDELSIERLIDRLEVEGVEDLILALNPSVEGDATCSYLKQVIPGNINVRRIGFGVPIGSHLEYLDSLTINKAFENTTRIH